MIKLKDACFAYGERPILKHLSLEIKAGEMVLIKGDNGCGKTTLLNIINALDFLDKGEYYFEDKQIDEKTMKNQSFSKQLHQKIGYVFQNTEVQLFCADVWEEIAFGPTQMGLSNEEISKRVEDMISLLGIEELKHRAPITLSMGEKKKVAIAAALAVNPKVIILDEPMNFLDEKSRQWVMDTMTRLHKAGKTIIIVSHTSHFDDEATQIINLTQNPHPHNN